MSKVAHHFIRYWLVSIEALNRGCRSERFRVGGFCRGYFGWFGFNGLLFDRRNRRCLDFDNLLGEFLGFFLLRLFRNLLLRGLLSSFFNLFDRFGLNPWLSNYHSLFAFDNYYLFLLCILTHFNWGSFWRFFRLVHFLLLIEALTSL